MFGSRKKRFLSSVLTARYRLREVGRSNARYSRCLREECWSENCCREIRWSKDSLCEECWSKDGLCEKRGSEDRLRKVNGLIHQRWIYFPEIFWFGDGYRLCDRLCLCGRLCGRLSEVEGCDYR